MNDFKKFTEVVSKNVERINSLGKLYRTEMDKDLIYDTYLNSYPEGTNEILNERREYDCNTCRNFLRDMGNVVAIVDNKLVSIWDDLENADIADKFKVVAAELSELVTSSKIQEPFKSPATYKNQKNMILIGVPVNHTQSETGEVLTWNHFHGLVSRDYTNLSGLDVSEQVQSTKVFKRALDEITVDAIKIVIDLIEDNILYRGEEHLQNVRWFHDRFKEYHTLNDKEKDIFIWKITDPKKRIRNTVIGTLLTDISDGVELEDAVKAFEYKVAPSNYKRPKALITKKQKEELLNYIKENDIVDSLRRRHAKEEDISINNVLYADRDTRNKMKDSIDELDELLSSSGKVENTLPDINKLEEISIDQLIDMISDIDKLEVLFENRLKSNLVSLIAPAVNNSKNILKWDNNFSWVYNGGVTDALKERVKSAGGKVDGDLRFSIQWNENGNDGGNDLDAHCEIYKKRYEKCHIYYSDKLCYKYNGKLDVDITNPKNQTGDGVAVENITFSDFHLLHDLELDFYVHNFSGVNTDGVRCQLEILGELYNIEYNRRISDSISIATVKIDDEGNYNVKFNSEISVNSSTKSENIWGINTNEFHKVKLFSLSPNHWDNNKQGNKHYMFFLENCATKDELRGLYNEFLNDDLQPLRKGFEVLGQQLKVEPVKDQLSGIGISSTSKQYVVVRVTTNGKTRTYKVLV